MKKYPVKARSCFDFICWAGVVGAVTFATNAVAQIVPDNTLGTERSTVTPAMVRGLPSDRIDGGAIRGSNLFHSFQQFNIGEGRGAYFVNPVGIENILSRVTGNSRSEILGRLGVLGNANLFLINPNGIVFGANASLDVAGSFTATTANAIALGDQGFFSATQPDKSSLLAIAPGALFFDQQLRQPRTIQNSGTLTAGRDLTLAADNLELQGQVRSGGNLTLQAQDTLRIRDSVTAPFIASAGGKLLVQGDQSVDIFALNHPDSGLFSGGDMVLRSTNTVGGDAYYSTGGKFRIEKLDSSLGNLSSPYDPYIIANGDVTFGTYTGASLHILAGGSVTIGAVTITELGTQANTVNPTLFPALAKVTLSDGTKLTIDGSAVATLDIRAGIDWSQLGGLPGNGGIGVNGLVPGNFSEPPSSANISIQNIENNFADSVVLLTNQFRPNRSLRGNITIGPDPTNAYGLVAVDARDDIRVTGNIDVSIPAGFVGDGGDIRLISERGNIDTRGALLTSSTQAGNGGSITLTARQGDITPGNITSSTASGGKAGDINIIGQSLTLANANTVSSDTSGDGRGGDVAIQVQSLLVTGGSEVVARTFGEGNAGNVTVNPLEPALLSLSSVTLSGIAPFARDANGNIQILDTDGNRTGGFSSGLQATTEDTPATKTTPAITATGRGGDLTINTGTLNIFDGAALSVRSRSSGSAGNITVNANTVNMAGGGQILTAAFKAGRAGNISVTAANDINISGIDPGYDVRFKQIYNALLARGFTPQDAFENTQFTVDPVSRSSGLEASDIGGIGITGNITLKARSLTLADRAIVESTTNGANNGEKSFIDIKIQNLSIAGGATVIAQTFGAGNAGDITVNPLDPNTLSSVKISGVTPFAGIAENILGQVYPDGGYSSGLLVSTETPPIVFPGTQPVIPTGSGGLITINTSALTIADGAVLGARSKSAGRSGDVKVNVNTLDITGGGQILTATYARGNAGDVTVTATDKIRISGFDANFDPRFKAIQQALKDPALGAKQKTPEEAFQLALFTVDPFSGASGIQAGVAPNAGVASSAGDLGIKANGGIIDITTTSLAMSNFADIGAGTYGQGDAGRIKIQASDSISMTTGSRINSFVGRIEDQESGVVVFGVGNANGITIATGSLSLESGATLQTQTSGQGISGVVFVQATNNVSLKGSDTAIFSTVDEKAVGNASGVLINANTLSMSDGAEIQALTRGQGDAGAIIVNAANSINLSGFSAEGGYSTGLFTSTESSASGKGGIIWVTTDTLNLSNGAVLSARTRNQYPGGAILVDAKVLEVTNGGQILTTAFNEGVAGTIIIARDILTTDESGAVSLNPNIRASDRVLLSGTEPNFSARQAQAFAIEDQQNRPRGSIFDNIAPGSSGVFANTQPSSKAAGGGIFIQADDLSILKGAAISVDTQGVGTAGNIMLGSKFTTLDQQSKIVATTRSGNGGNIEVSATKYLLLRRDSNIRTDAGLGSGTGDGGNIVIRTPFIIAAPSKDNNITARAVNNRGGNVDVSAPDGGETGLFGIRFRPEDNPRTNDITASSERGPAGNVSINVLNTSVIENNLAELAQNFIDSNKLLANSCIVRNREKNRTSNGTFLVTGSGGLPVRPGDAPPASFPTGEVRSLPEAQTNQTWQPGDPIAEPQGIYRLANGKLVMSRECEP